MEDKLKAMAPLEDDRGRLKEQFNSYNAFMNEVKQQDQAVGEVSLSTVTEVLYVDGYCIWLVQSSNLPLTNPQSRAPP